MYGGFQKGEVMRKKEKKVLSCAEAQSMITQYIKDSLSMKETGEFLRHISECHECREELGVYYTILTGMQKLDADENISMDFTEELRKKLKRSEEKISRCKRNSMIRRVLFFIIIMAWSWVDFAVDTREEPEKSSFELKEYFFRGRDLKTDQYVKTHYNAMMGERVKYNYGKQE